MFVTHIVLEPQQKRLKINPIILFIYRRGVKMMQRIVGYLNKSIPIAPYSGVNSKAPRWLNVASYSLVILFFMWVIWR